jgi:hypothetical protein
VRELNRFMTYHPFFSVFVIVFLGGWVPITLWALAFVSWHLVIKPASAIAYDVWDIWLDHYVDQPEHGWYHDGHTLPQ